MTVRTAKDVPADGIAHDVDVCIVGSGAGGAVLAAGLAEAGLRVLVLEAGPYRTRDDFTLQERDAYPTLYQEAAGRTSADGAVQILQGRSVGGSTTVNWTSCFRTPKRILDHWAEHFGLEMLTPDTLDSHWTSVEERLNIHEWPKGAANPNNQVLFRGAEKLGWESGSMRRNVRGCANSGYCGVGCPVDGKQAMHVTYIQDAIRAGAIVQAEAPVQRILSDGKRVTGVLAGVQPMGSGLPDGRQIRVQAKVVVASGGAINTPALLHRSQLGRDLPVGHRTFLHPVIPVFGTYEQAIQPWYGAPQSAHSHEFIDRGADKLGFFLEASPIHPMLAGTALKAHGAAQWSFMRQLAHTAGLLSLHVDGLVEGDVGGVVRIDAHGRPVVDYPIRPALVEAMTLSHEVLTKVHLAAGAELVGTSHVEPVRMRSGAELSKLKTAKYGAFEHGIFTAHQMGGCTMGTDRAKSVVGPDYRMHGMDNLFVVDGSVLPTALGVNPSQTIYGLAHRAREFVAAAV